MLKKYIHEYITCSILFDKYMMLILTTIQVERMNEKIIVY